MAGDKKPGQEDDAALLAKVFRDVTPLPGRRINAKAKTAAPPKPTVKRIKTRSAPPPQKPRRPDLVELTHGSAPGVDKRTAQRLKRGKLEVEARLDLHGHTQATGHRALEAFIDGDHGARKRCVLVITGKGYNDGPRDGPGGRSVGVLRQAVPKWLNQSPIREKVLSFTHAAPADGGSGALYILLKRKR